jgi:hypothetical protein
MKNNNFTHFGLTGFPRKENSVARNESQYALSVFGQLFGY